MLVVLQGVEYHWYNRCVSEWVCVCVDVATVIIVLLLCYSEVMCMTTSACHKKHKHMVSDSSISSNSPQTNQTLQHEMSKWISQA